MRSTPTDPAFASSANSSDADAPPVWISEMTSVDVGHATATVATCGVRSTGARGTGRWAAVAIDAAIRMRARAKGRAAGPARRARDIDDLPAGLSDSRPRSEPPG